MRRPACRRRAAKLPAPDCRSELLRAFCGKFSVPRRSILLRQAFRYGASLDSRVFGTISNAPSMRLPRRTQGRRRWRWSAIGRGAVGRQRQRYLGLLRRFVITAAIFDLAAVTATADDFGRALAGDRFAVFVAVAVGHAVLLGGSPPTMRDWRAERARRSCRCLAGCAGQDTERRDCRRRECHYS